MRARLHLPPSSDLAWAQAREAGSPVFCVSMALAKVHLAVRAVGFRKRDHAVSLAYMPDWTAFANC